MTGLSTILLAQRQLRAAADRLTGSGDPATLALAKPIWPFLVSALTDEVERAVLVVAATDDEARELSQELSAIHGAQRVALWPSRGTVSQGRVGPAPHLIGLRSEARDRLIDDTGLVVASIGSLLERVPRRPAPPSIFESGDALRANWSTFSWSAATSACTRWRSGARSPCAAASWTSIPPRRISRSASTCSTTRSTGSACSPRSRRSPSVRSPRSGSSPHRSLSRTWSTRSISCGPRP